MEEYIAKDIDVNGKKYCYDFYTGNYAEDIELLKRKLFDKDIQNIENSCTELMRDADFICVTIMTTSACNFRCSYCFEEHGQMFVSEVAIPKICEIVEQYKKIHVNVKRFIVIWFGGEPTLALDFILKANEQFKILSKKIDVLYSSRMITNGYLLDVLIPYIGTLNLTDIQITLDGLQKSHDSRRIHAAGKGTFDKIIENVLKIKQSVDLIIRVNVDSNNMYEATDLYKYIADLPINKNVSVYFQPMIVEDYGGDSTCYLGNIINDGVTYTQYLEMLKLIKNIEHPRFIRAFCNVDFSGTFVITSDGKVVKCWADINDCESRGLSIYDTETQTILEEFESPVFRKRYERCNDCVVYPACLGGCKYINYTEKDCYIKRKMLMLQAENYIEYDTRNI